MNMKKAIVKPHLEYCLQAWRAYRKKDMDKLHKMQQRATKLIPELTLVTKNADTMWFDSNYDKLRVDQTFVFEILNGYEDIARKIFFKLKEDIYYLNLRRILKPVGTNQHL